MDKITMLGTGAAMVTHCYNTCYTISSNNAILLVDGGGGNQILRQLELANLPIQSIHYAFVTHNHSDHLLGMVWVLRTVAQAMNRNKYEGDFHLFAHESTIEALYTICGITLTNKVLAQFGQRIQFHRIQDGSEDTLPMGQLTFFSLHSKKMLQHGFKLVLNNGIKFAYHGDEPFTVQNEQYCKEVDYLMLEAFCSFEDAEQFKPYEKSHGTATDSCLAAKKLNASSVILVHTEDTTLNSRKARYRAEGKHVFDGDVYVPDDLDEIELTKSGK